MVCSCRGTPPLELVAVPAMLEDIFSTIAGKYLEMFPVKQLVPILGSKPLLDQRRHRGLPDGLQAGSGTCSDCIPAAGQGTGGSRISGLPWEHKALCVQSCYWSRRCEPSSPA